MPLKPQLAQGARGEEGRAQAQATTTTMEVGVSLDIKSAVDIVRKLVKSEAPVDGRRQWEKRQELRHDDE